MKEVIALQEYTDKHISLYEGEIRNIEDKLANELIEKGIIAEHSSDEENNNSNIIYLTAKYNGRNNTFVDINVNKNYQDTTTSITQKPTIIKIAINTGTEEHPEFIYGSGFLGKQTAHSKIVAFTPIGVDLTDATNGNFSGILLTWDEENNIRLNFAGFDIGVF